jgi:DNA-binding CsgD family transcriptional regulator
MARTPVTSKDDDRLKQKQLLMMTHQDVIERRRINVIQLRLQGLTTAEVAKRLSVSTDTVAKDIEAIRKANNKYVEEFNQKDFVGDTLNVYSAIEKDAWAQVATLPQGDSRRVKFLDAVRNTRKEQIKLLQNSGLLHKEAEKVEVQITTQVIDGWTDEQKLLISEAMVEASLDDFIALPEPKEIKIPSKEEFTLEDFAEFSTSANEKDGKEEEL